MFDEKESFENNVSKNTVTERMIGEGDENSPMDVWADYSVDIPIEKDYDILSPYTVCQGSLYGLFW